jgi:hypothetical protein
MTAPAGRRCAIAFLGANQVAALLGLPEGIRVVGIRDDFQRDGVLVMLEGDSLELTPPECVPPNYTGSMFTGSLMRMSTELRGWGPDFTDITAQCPLPCSWEHTWGDSVTMAEIARVVGEHLAEQHGMS